MRPSTKGKHQKGQARKQRDASGEKGDARRTPNPNKRRQPNNSSVAQTPIPMPGPGPNAELDPTRDNFAGLKNGVQIAGTIVVGGALIVWGICVAAYTGNIEPLQYAFGY